MLKIIMEGDNLEDLRISTNRILQKQLFLESEDIKNLGVDSMGLTVRAVNCLRLENIITLKDLLKYSEEELLKIPNFGLTSLKDLRSGLEHLGKDLFKLSKSRGF